MPFVPAACETTSLSFGALPTAVAYGNVWEELGDLEQGIVRGDLEDEVSSRCRTVVEWVEMYRTWVEGGTGATFWRGDGAGAGLLGANDACTMCLEMAFTQATYRNRKL